MVTADYGFIYDLGGGKYALGLAGAQAQRVVFLPSSATQQPRGVTGRRPRIPVDAKKLSRRAAGRTLCRALGVTR